MRMMPLGASLAILVLAGCIPQGEGCATYGQQRPSMPELSDDPLGAWVAVTDTAMTRACKG
jgi:hypothetical protein